MSEIIWQSILDQLRATMPRSAFDTWVADTQFVSSTDTLFLVGCRNASSRNWLESRVQSTIEHLLTERLNRSVTVSFIITGDQVDKSGNGEPELSEDELQVEAVWDSAYEQVVQPEKAIVINAYFLRYLRLLGPELGWLYVGFRQAAYSSGGRSGSRTARFTGEMVAALSGMSKRAFWRRVGSQETWRQLAGLVNLVGEKPLWDEKSATPKRLPRKYSVSMTLPLTATDARSLMRWIAAHMADAGGPVGVLELACKTPVEEIIPVNATSVIGYEPLPVSQIVRELFLEEISEVELKALAERLQMHLMPPGELVMISLFFVEHVLPHLGPGPGWMLTVLRDRCWVNPESGEARNRVTVKGGYADIAGWMGLERAMTIYEWLHGRQRKWLPVRSDNETTKKPNPKAGQYLNPALRVYVRETGQGVDDFAEGSREFEVLLDEIPAEIMAAIVKEDPSAIYATGTIGFTQLSQDVYATGTIGFTQLAQDVYATGTIGFTQLAQELYATGRVFKLLSSCNSALNLKTKPEHPQKTPVIPPVAENSKALGADAPVRVLENQNPDERIQAFPEDLRQTAAVFVAEFNLLPPSKPEPGEKGGDFALWIKGLRQLKGIAADYGVPIEKAMRLAQDYWNQRPFTLSHPLALKSAMQSVLSRQKAATTPPTFAPAQPQPAYDPAQRRQEISAILGFDIDQPMTSEQQTALQTYLDGLLAKLPQNPLKPQSGEQHV